jgi:hypothetical protein
MPFKTIRRHDVEKAIHSIHHLDAKQKERLKGVFFSDQDYGGLTKFEFEKRMRQLEKDNSDGLSRFELGKVKEVLGGLMEDPAEEEENHEEAA